MCLKGAPGVRGHVWFIELSSYKGNLLEMINRWPAWKVKLTTCMCKAAVFFRHPLTILKLSSTTLLGNTQSLTRLGTWPFSPKSFKEKISIRPGNHISALSAWKQFFQKLPKKLRQKLLFSACVFAGPRPTFWNPAMADQSRWFVKEKPLEERIKASSGAG